MIWRKGEAVEKKVAEIHSSLISTLTIKAPTIHIYPFSRLIGAPAGRWEQLVSDLESKEQIVYRYYQPVREAIVRLTEARGEGREEIFEKMSQQALGVIHTGTQNPVKDNQKCFASFEKHFLPKIGSFERSLLKVPQISGTFFSGVILKGLPHMVVKNQKGKSRFVYLYPSSWQEDELDAYMELLTIIVEAEFGADAADIWCMGLKKGETIHRPKAKVRTRKKCVDAAKLLKRMSDTGILSLK